MVLFAATASAVSVTDGLIIHLKADSLSLNDNDAVTAWPDSAAGDSVDGTVSQVSDYGVPVFKTNVYNGMPAVRFTRPADPAAAPNSQKQVLASGTWRWDQTKGVTVFLVCTGGMDGSSNQVQRVVQVGKSSGEVYKSFGCDVNSNQSGAADTGSGVRFNKGWCCTAAAGPNPVRQGVWHVSVRQIAQRGGYGSLFYAVDDLTALPVTANQPGRSISFDAAGNDITIGNGRLYNGKWVPLDWYDGDVAEVLVYNKQLAAKQKQSVLNYLLTKYDHADPDTVVGVVYEDVNKSGKYDSGDHALQNVAVSNGRDLVLTDSMGMYSLPISGDADIFVIKPEDYHTALDSNNLPKFYYMHRPNGSPSMTYAAFSPTGPLPDSVDFALYAEEEPDEFQVLVFGDPQPADLTKVEYMIRDVIEDVIYEGYNETAAFGISLGDIAGNDLSLYDRIKQGFGQMKLPWYNVPGNHDRNSDAPALGQRYETFKSKFGPAYYAFNYGSAHFIILNDIWWIGSGNDKFVGGLGADQLEFIENDLACVPSGKLIVLAMHIPFTNSRKWNSDRAALFSLLQNRSYLLTYAGHVHNRLIRRLDTGDGWNGKDALHHIIPGAICGPWWNGLPDEYGIPASMMTDGTPNGYEILKISGNRYVHTYKIARRSISNQMHLHAPQNVAQGDLESTYVYANIYSAWSTADVQMRVDEGSWVSMTRSVEEDPAYVDYKTLCGTISGWTTPNPTDCWHLWRCILPKGLSAGMHLIKVVADNPDGQVFYGNRVIRVAD